MDQALVDRYEAGADTLRRAAAGLTDADFAAVPVPGKWSLRQLVVHLADSDLVMADRMKRVIAEDHPSLLAFDENKWTAELKYDAQSAADAVELLALNRKQMARVLRQLPDSALDRWGTHSVTGRKSLRELIDGAVRHLDHHLTFLYEKRTKLGKPA